MAKKILVMGLPGSGKTTVAKELKKILNADWVNADSVRKKYKDWDFSKKGVLRQAKRMRDIADNSKKKFVIADFICPYEKGRKIFRADYLIWMDTIKKGRLPTFDKNFQKPKRFNLKLTKKRLKTNLISIKDLIFNYKWKDNFKTSLMIGEFNPWKKKDRDYFEKLLPRTGQILIMVKKNFKFVKKRNSFTKIKSQIEKDLKIFKNRFKIISIPNITKIY